MKKPTVIIKTPQFKRIDGIKPYLPKASELEKIVTVYSHDRLKKIGCQIWNKSKKAVHYLFPGEWYKIIPNGFEIITISGEKQKFRKGVTDDDIRYGALPFGFIRKN